MRTDFSPKFGYGFLPNGERDMKMGALQAELDHPTRFKNVEFVHNKNTGNVGYVITPSPGTRFRKWLNHLLGR